MILDISGGVKQGDVFLYHFEATFNGPAANTGEKMARLFRQYFPDDYIQHQENVSWGTSMNYYAKGDLLLKNSLHRQKTK